MKKQNKTNACGGSPLKTKQMPADAISFDQYLQSKNLAKSTQKRYLTHIDQFINWYEADPINSTKSDIINHLSYLKNNRQQANTTRKNALNALNHYFTFLQKSNLISTNPTTLLKIRGIQRKTIHNVITKEELTQLADDYYHNFIRNHQDHHIPKSIRLRSFLSRQRNHIMLNLLIHQGLATSELQKIKLHDLDLIKATIKIPSGLKTNTRNIPLEATQIGSLINYTQNIRPQFDNYCLDTDQLFLPLPSQEKTTRYTHLETCISNLNRQVRTLAGDQFTFRQVRASVITHWIKTYGLRKAQYLAGHKSISSTENYKINDLESLTEDIAKFHPF